MPRATAGGGETLSASEELFHPKLRDSNLSIALLPTSDPCLDYKRGLNALATRCNGVRNQVGRPSTHNFVL